jgi:hypothetical protein
MSESNPFYDRKIENLEKLLSQFASDNDTLKAQNEEIQNNIADIKKEIAFSFDEVKTVLSVLKEKLKLV